MKITRNEVNRLVRVFIVFFALILILGYSIYATHDLMLGPEIIIIEPSNEHSFATSSITIRGIAKRSQNIILNGKSITVDENGNFKEVTLLAKGYNVFSLIAQDRLKRQKEYRLELVNTLK